MNFKKILDSSRIRDAYSDKLTKKEIEQLETPIEDIRKAAKALGLTERETASWIEGPNFSNYKEADLKKGDKAAEKFLGKEFEGLDLTNADIPQAVLKKINKRVKDSKSGEAHDVLRSITDQIHDFFEVNYGFEYLDEIGFEDMTFVERCSLLEDAANSEN